MWFQTYIFIFIHGNTHRKRGPWRSVCLSPFWSGHLALHVSTQLSMRKDMLGRHVAARHPFPRSTRNFEWHWFRSDVSKTSWKTRSSSRADFVLTVLQPIANIQAIYSYKNFYGFPIRDTFSSFDLWISSLILLGAVIC